MRVKPPLNLVQYFFPYIEVAADPEYIPENKEISPFFDVKMSLDYDNENGENGLYQLTLEIIAKPENEESRIPYTIKLITVGLFEVQEGFENPEKLLRITGASMLYSAAREFIITITARGPWSKVILPTISFGPKKEEPKPKPPVRKKKTKAKKQ